VADPGVGHRLADQRADLQWWTMLGRPRVLFLGADLVVEQKSMSVWCVMYILITGVPSVKGNLVFNSV